MQVYAALSRVRSLDGLQVIGFQRALVRASTRAVQYYDQWRSPSTVAARAPIVAAVSRATGAGAAAASAVGAVRAVSMQQPQQTPPQTAQQPQLPAQQPQQSPPQPRQLPVRRTISLTDASNRSACASVVPAASSDSPAATIGNGVEVRRSNLPNAGLGLFATRAFAAGELVTEYDGCVIDEVEAKARQDQKVSTHIRSLGPKHAFIDGRDVPNERWRGGASFVNDPLSRVWYNTEFFQYRPAGYTPGVSRGGSNVFERVYVRATKAIPPGEEVYVDYGKDFWDLYPLAK